MVAGYFGADSPLAHRLGVGKELRTEHGMRQLTPVNDRWAFGLTTIMVPGGHWIIQHDSHAALVCGDAVRAGVSGQTEVSHLFSDLLPPNSRGPHDCIRPDFVLERTLYDVKMLHFQPVTYTLRNVLISGRRSLQSTCVLTRSTLSTLRRRAGSTATTTPTSWMQISAPSTSASLSTER